MIHVSGDLLVGVRGFEPPAPAFRTQYSNQAELHSDRDAYIAGPHIGGNPHNASGQQLCRLAAFAGLGLPVVPGIHQLQHGRGGLLDRAACHINGRPTVAEIKNFSAIFIIIT